VEYRLLGRTGVHVSRLCLGTMTLGSDPAASGDAGVRIVNEALDAGINFIDTADVYGAGESERVVGQTLAGGRRDSVILATKVRGPMGDGPNDMGNSRRWITRAVEESLRRLRTDWIDLYQVHRPEYYTDLDETLGALSDLVHAGKVRYIGCSTFPASMIVEALWTAERRGRERLASEQPPYSMLSRGVESDVLPTCVRHGVGVIAWSPLAGGWLAGGYRIGQDAPPSTRAAEVPRMYDLGLPENQRKLQAADALAGVAERAGMSLIEMAISFVTSHPAITSAIIGPRSLDQLRSYLGSTTGRLDDDMLDEIDTIVPPGMTINPIDSVGGWQNPILDREFRRQRGPSMTVQADGSAGRQGDQSASAASRKPTM
jgi:aryl-alcohol dehydrogenase-like predicted oxidoreductase